MLEHATLLVPRKLPGCLVQMLWKNFWKNTKVMILWNLIIALWIDTPCMHAVGPHLKNFLSQSCSRLQDSFCSIESSVIRATWPPSCLSIKLLRMLFFVFLAKSQRILRNIFELPCTFTLLIHKIGTKSHHSNFRCSCVAKFCV